MFQTIETAWRRYRKVVAFLLLGILIGALVTWRFIAILEHYGVFKAKTADISKDESALLEMPESNPVRLRVASVGIDAIFEDPLGLNKYNEVEVPEDYDKLGWYKYGPTPGEVGPSVILGHLDSYADPAVFYPLRQVKVGDEIFVDREDGTTAVFEVTETKTPSQWDFPTEEVYGDIDHAGLRLVTCTGSFDKGERRYSHNFIVFAKLIAIEN